MSARPEDDTVSLAEPRNSTTMAKGSSPAGIRPLGIWNSARAAGVATKTGVASAAALALPWSHPTPAEDGPERHLSVVESPRFTPAQRRRLIRASIVAGVGLVTAIALLVVYMHVVLSERQFRLDKLNASVQQQQAQYQNLRLQVAQLGSPQHIISTAEGQLHMVRPAKVTYLAPSESTDPPAGSGDSATAAFGNPATGNPATGNQAAADAPTNGIPPANGLGDADWPLIKSQLAATP